jgi:hypothetical protein
MNGLACNLSTSISTLAVTLQAAANPDSITTVNCSVGSSIADIPPLITVVVLPSFHLVLHPEG